jgi:hypothetical protein
MDLDNIVADMSDLVIPGNVITDFEAFSHLILPTRNGANQFNAQRSQCGEPSWRENSISRKSMI